jgi:hypothetical protein
MATRTWVSGVGDDANPGSRTAPCKTFAGAISKTDAGGEIDALDPGGFGAITITKSVTIDGGTGSGWASILSTGTTGVTINAAATDVIRLRNLSINGGGSGLRGVRILSAAFVLIEDCVVFNFRSAAVNSGIGVSDERSAGGALVVLNTTITGNSTGMVLLPSSGSNRITAELQNVRLVGNAGAGLRASTATLVAVSHCIIANNGAQGILADQPSGVTEVHIDGSLIMNNSIGIATVTGNPTVRLSDSTVVNNGIGLGITNGAVTSYGNNRIISNGSGNNPSPGLIGLK